MSEVARQSQVQEQFEGLNGIISMAEDQMGALLGNLAPVMRSMNKTPEDDAPEEELCSHADSIRAYRKRVAAISNSMGDIISRLEV